MKTFITSLSLAILTSLGLPVQAQNFAANYSETETQPQLSYTELISYRESIWETPPAAVGWVNDYEGILSEPEEQILNAEIAHLERKTSIEIAIVTIDSLMVEKEKFNDFADHILFQWGVGKKEKDNGILICISSQLKNIKLSYGAGIEKYFTEPEIMQLIKTHFLPSFAKNKYYIGVYQGLQAIINKVSNQVFTLSARWNFINIH